MTEQFKPAKQVKPEQTVIFFSPLQPDNRLVRTGTLAEGSCFFHSILRACDSEYADMLNKDRFELVSQIRRKLSKQVSREEWLEMGGGDIAKVQWQSILLSVLSDCFKLTETKGKKSGHLPHKLKSHIRKNLPFFSVVFSELLSLKEFEKEILPPAYEKSKNNSVPQSMKEVQRSILVRLAAKPQISALDDKKLRQLRDKILSFIGQVMEFSFEAAFEEYKESVYQPDKYVDQSTISLISNYMDRDIYFIDGTSRMPYQNTSTEDNLKGRLSIVVAYIEDSHYEVVGRLYGNKEIEREFSPDDPLIRKMKLLLCHPEKIRDEYPELLPYTPSKYQRQDERSDDEGSPCSLSESDDGTPSSPESHTWEIGEE